MWIYFLQLNTGSAWKTLEAVFIQADISSDASGRTFAGVVSKRDHPDRVVAREFWGNMLAMINSLETGQDLERTMDVPSLHEQ